jgi:arylsulfatase A-like enzyme
MLRKLLITTALVATATAAPLTRGADAVAQTPAKPNIVVIMADDVGIWNVSAYHRGMMGGSTPNIDRIAKEGALFTDYYAQQSCTAGRAAFILGTDAIPDRTVEGRHAGGQAGACRTRIRPLPNC